MNKIKLATSAASLLLSITAYSHSRADVPQHKITTYIQTTDQNLSTPVAFADNIEREGYNVIFIAFGLFDKDKTAVHFSAFIKDREVQDEYMVA